MATRPHEMELTTVRKDTSEVYSYATTVPIIKRQAVEHAGMPSSTCKRKILCVIFLKTR